MQSHLNWQKHLPESSDFFSGRILLFDPKVIAGSSIDKKKFREWASRFPLAIPLLGGEKLKSLEKFSEVLKRIHNFQLRTGLKIEGLVGLGGGSVTDFVGFVASVYKRGVGLAFIPSTWVCAVDSVHGGKTGLNFLGVKNQIGTFYPANEIYLVESLLRGQPAGLAAQGLSEMAKVFLLRKPRVLKKFLNDLTPMAFASNVPRAVLNSKRALTDEVRENVLWKHLGPAVKAKLEIVARDPEEKSGLRRLLNFGHTLGHVFESYFKIPHGVAVAEGLRFACRWSAHRELMNARVLDELEVKLFPFLPRISPGNRLLNRRFATRTLGADKKVAKSGRLNFVFLKNYGIPRIEEVTVGEVIKEAERQGWIRS